MAESKELQVKEKQEVTNPAEQMQPGLVFTPDVDIFESDRDITLLVDMPGVAENDVDIRLEEGVLTISGSVKTWENKDEKDVFIEFEIGKYFRQFTISKIIDQGKIEAKLEDGVLRLTLPKEEKALPRKISITTD